MKREDGYKLKGVKNIPTRTLTDQHSQPPVFPYDWTLDSLPNINSTIERDRCPTPNTLKSGILNMKHRLKRLNIWFLTGDVW